MQIKFSRYSNNNIKLIVILDDDSERIFTRDIDKRLNSDEIFLDDRFDNVQILIREDIIYPYIQFMDIVKYGHDCGSYKLTMRGIELLQTER